MTAFEFAAVFLLGAAVCAIIFTIVLYIRGRKQGTRRKAEFSKLVLASVLLTYFVGVFIGVKISLIDITQLGVLLAYIGTPTAAAIGFYCWKAKAENLVKIKRDNPEETKDIPVDLNNINNTSA